MTISVSGPPLEQFNSRPAIDKWWDGGKRFMLPRFSTYQPTSSSTLTDVEGEENDLSDLDFNIRIDSAQLILMESQDDQSYVPRQSH